MNRKIANTSKKELDLFSYTSVLLRFGRRWILLLMIFIIISPPQRQRQYEQLALSALIIYLTFGSALEIADIKETMAQFLKHVIYRWRLLNDEKCLNKNFKTFAENDKEKENEI
ncbi:hypothetical protein NPIL_574441 [Nephila pilipes]|uniref:Uncharacterized protein n=1 Tax=Nephila pilipes TaxID=299642 RepID=A0A8X6NDU0_NEPPI|nr:hypothetical protein NPIL_574441 [Nephila pilipes]